jgi:hypothetical protein
MLPRDSVPMQYRTRRAAPSEQSTKRSNIAGRIKAGNGALVQWGGGGRYACRGSAVVSKAHRAEETASTDILANAGRNTLLPSEYLCRFNCEEM